jgi:hypothetical protein
LCQVVRQARSIVIALFAPALRLRGEFVTWSATMTKSERRAFSGGCHCGAIRISFQTSIPPEQVDVRADQCSFCRKHGNNTSSDPQGSVVVHAKRAALSKYRFGLKNADFLICKDCGVFVAAIIDHRDGSRATVNLNALDDRALFTKPARQVTFDGETGESRTARRLKNWTPARLVVE